MAWEIHTSIARFAGNVSLPLLKVFLCIRLIFAFLSCIRSFFSYKCVLSLHTLIHNMCFDIPSKHQQSLLISCIWKHCCYSSDISAFLWFHSLWQRRLTCLWLRVSTRPCDGVFIIKKDRETIRIQLEVNLSNWTFNIHIYVFSLFWAMIVATLSLLLWFLKI